jgi:hypothetical protein
MNDNGSRSMGYNFAIIAFGILLFVIGLVGIINNHSFRANAVEVECEVTDIVKQGRTSWLANSHAIVTYEFDGQTYENIKVGTSLNAAIGETKTILVNPANPSKPRDPVGTTSVPRGTMIVGLLFAFSGCLGVYLYMKKSSL